MHRSYFSNSMLFRTLIVLTLTHAVLSPPAFAKDEPKTYPEAGKVIGKGTRGVSPSFTRTYKVETDTKIYQLDCGKNPFLPGFIPGTTSTGGECGGDKKLQIGDVIHFRTKKEWAFMLVTIKSDGPNPEEQKLRIISEELKPDPKTDQTKP